MNLRSMLRILFISSLVVFLGYIFLKSFDSFAHHVVAFKKH
ncbi:hypothetical protein J2Y60_004279 [Arcicella sp. BE140]|nr:hypothetical protein [Arcicella sp. BE51]MDR6814063.1 hypothetical protein [Arcicella sp. BE140]MDR6825375.1 hypothetical protein [Arcicella sp. BE139]